MHWRNNRKGNFSSVMHFVRKIYYLCHSLGTFELLKINVCTSSIITLVHQMVHSNFSNGYETLTPTIGPFKRVLFHLPPFYCYRKNKEISAQLLMEHNKNWIVTNLVNRTPPQIHIYTTHHFARNKKIERRDKKLQFN